MTSVGSQLVLRAFGETPMEAVDHHLQLVEQPRPPVALLERDEVLVRVRSCAVGWVDLLMMSGQYQHMVEPPYTPGLEFAGEVAGVGAEVEGIRVGDRVLADPLATGPRTKGPHRRNGGMASWAVMPAGAAMLLPECLHFDQAVNLLGNYETALHVLETRARVEAGEWVLVLGASGSTGVAAVDVAKRRGAKVIAAGRTAAKLEVLEQRGADEVLLVSDSSGAPRRFRDEVKYLTGGGADVVYDAVGGAVSTEALRCLRFGGRFCIVGWASTPFVARGRGRRGAPRANQLATNIIQMKGLSVLGCPAVIATTHDPSLRPMRLRTLFEWVQEGLRPHHGPSFSLAEFQIALRSKWNSQHVGGCVLHP